MSNPTSTANCFSALAEKLTAPASSRIERVEPIDFCTTDLHLRDARAVYDVAVVRLHTEEPGEAGLKVYAFGPSRVVLSSMSVELPGAYVGAARVVAAFIRAAVEA